MRHPDPRSQRTGVAFTVSMAAGKVLGLSEEMTSFICIFRDRHTTYHRNEGFYTSEQAGAEEGHMIPNLSYKSSLYS